VKITHRLAATVHFDATVQFDPSTAQETRGFYGSADCIISQTIKESQSDSASLVFFEKSFQFSNSNIDQSPRFRQSQKFTGSEFFGVEEEGTQAIGFSGATIGGILGSILCITAVLTIGLIRRQKEE
jgi:hypothetical protein